ncbi:MAG TPA: PPOX class F420-dependent oxidoreductase [Chloroflexia bacterium]|nr:PPOX class F420-dependent oxidoreductase [Chloroflexia bacterium]
MSVFTSAELEYLLSQRLGRLATVDAAGTLHVVPVGYRYNSEADAIDLGGTAFGRSKKYRDAARHGQVAFVVDDVPAPGRQRGVEIRGVVEVFTTGGDVAIRPGADPEFIRIAPRHIASWGLDTSPFEPRGRDVPETARPQAGR